MDPVLARRLNQDEEFTKKVTKLAREYIQLGRQALDYWSGDFDIAYDTMMCYAPLSKKDYEGLADGHPKRFIMPLTATQITTMATYITQVLFGQDTPHKVEPRGPEDEIPAEYMNQLLRWNAEQQPTYLLGLLWAQHALVTNRGVFYNSWAPIYGHQIVQEPAWDMTVDPPAQYFRTKRKRTPVGGFCKYEPLLPYDFICDPTLPLWKFQEGRFAGHRTVIPFVELVRRSELSPDDPAYILPSAIEALKKKKKTDQNALVAPNTGGSATTANSTLSYTAYERTKTANPNGSQTANKEDLGNIECFELWVNLIPKDHEIFEDGAEPTTFQFLIAGDDVVCCLNESTYAHGEYPYCVGEGRPSGVSQFSPSWVLMLKGLQDHVDWLKNRHQEALARTVGNIFIYNPEYVDVDDFMNPEKEGLLIALKANAGGQKISDVISQVPVKDLTENFHVEMVEFARMSENVTGANTYMQGNTAGEASATEFAGAQQMGAGRMASVARVLSTQALVPQTRQIVSNFQQFLSIPQAMRFTPSENTPEALMGVVSLILSKDVIQGQFDFVPHDGTLPGTDGKKVAAIAQLLESAAAFPDVFGPAPGNLNPRRLIFAAAKAAGVNIENFKYRPQDIPSITPPPGAQTPIGAGAGGPGGPPGPNPSDISGAPAPSLASPQVGPPQTRPANS